MSDERPSVHHLAYPSALVRMVDAVGGRLSWPPLTGASWRAAAEASAGATTWDPEVVAGMAALEEDVREVPPSFVGRLAMDGALQQGSTSYAWLQRRVREGAPKGRVERPIVIVGLHRTGTTLLQHLLAALPGRRFIPMYALMDPARPRRWRAELAVRVSRLIGPEMWRVHPVWPVGPEECWMLMMNAWRCWDWTMHWSIPRYTAWLASADMGGAYGSYLQQIRLLQAGRDDRVVMKGPAHLFALDALLDVVPDAVVVWVHRDPVTCVASFASLSAVHHRTMYGRFDPAAVGAHLLGAMADSVDRGMAADRGRIMHLRYADLVSRPVDVVAAVADRAGERMDRDRVEAALRAQIRGAPARHVYGPAQWGLTEDGVRRRFRAYLAEHAADLSD